MKRITIIIMAFVCMVSMQAVAETREGVQHSIQSANGLINAHKWHEAFEILRAEEAKIGSGQPGLHYLIYKQRYRMYSRINKDAEAKGNLLGMEKLAYRSGDKAIIEDMLLNKAAYWQREGKPAVSGQCYKEIFYRRSAGLQADAKEQCFKKTIADAKKMNVPGLAGVVQKMYTAWQDSIASEKSAAAMRALQKKYDAAMQDNDSKAAKITAQWVAIGTLIVIAIALAAALVFFIFLKIRSMVVVKKLKKSLDIANSSSERKSVFIRNISGQIMPSLEQIEFGNVKVQVNALKRMLGHVEEYMQLEGSREEKYPVEDYDVQKVCRKVCDDMTTEEIPVSVVDTQSMSFALNADAIDYVLKSVINEMRAMDGINHITLSFKKRNPTMGNFVITAVGPKIPEEDREGVFTAFSKVYDLAKTDGLTLPTCAIVAYKMGGNILLDDSFAKGTRIVLEVHKQ